MGWGQTKDKDKGDSAKYKLLYHLCPLSLYLLVNYFLQNQAIHIYRLIIPIDDLHRMVSLTFQQ